MAGGGLGSAHPLLGKGHVQTLPDLVQTPGRGQGCHLPFPAGLLVPANFGAANSSACKKISRVCCENSVVFNQGCQE